jgi:hypothetical protein
MQVHAQIARFSKQGAHAVVMGAAGDDWWARVQHGFANLGERIETTFHEVDAQVTAEERDRAMLASFVGTFG